MERQARDRLAAELRRLRDKTAGSPGGRITQSEIGREVGAGSRRISELFLHGTTSTDLARRVIELLERRLSRPLYSPQHWEELLQASRAEAKSQQGGRPNNEYRPTAPPLLREIEPANQYRPLKQNGDRIEAEVRRLESLIRGTSGYLSLEAPPWSGKTTLLATFAATVALPSTNLVAYFVRRGTGSDTARHFRDTMLRVLSDFTGKNPTGKNTAELLKMYEAAAVKSAEYGRDLLLIIDGLDEDAEGSSGGGTGASIASLLPARPHPGITVLVARRRHPDLPDDILPDHPLRHAYRIPFQPVPEAVVQGRLASRDLNAFLREGTWGREIVGFLALAGGGLTESALMQLIETGEHDDMPITFDLTLRLHSVAGRGFSLEELEPNEYVLAHEELYRAALTALNSPLRAALLYRLHAWADGYREAGWPDNTPGYLLYRYLNLLSMPDQNGRRIAFTLDHRRSLRLAARGRADLALSAIEDLAQALPNTIVLASAAASKSLLLAAGKPVPREMLRALSMVGDGERARALALRASDPLSKAARLVEVVLALSSVNSESAKEQAKRFAKEAAEWAEKAERDHRLLTAPSEWDAPSSIIPAIVIMMAKADLTDDAIRLLGRVDLRRPENIEPAARAAELLRTTDPALSDRVMDELTLEAQGHAEAEDGDPVLAVQTWASVAMHDAGRSKQALLKMKDLSERMATASPSLAAADCCAITASTMAASAMEHRTQARALADTAKDLALAARGAGLDDQLGGSVTLLVKAFLDLGDPHDAVRNELAAFTETVAARAASIIDDTAAAEEDADEIEKLRLLQHFSELGDGPLLRKQIDRHLRSFASAEGYLAWLPYLSEALANAQDKTGLALVRSMCDGKSRLLQVRVTAAAARGYAEAGARDEAQRCAADAADTAGCIDSEIPEARALVAQAFAYADDAARAALWTRPPSGIRPLGREGTLYRRAALAVQAGLEPAAFVTAALAEGLRGAGITATGSNLIEAFGELASGAVIEARIATLRSTAHARLATEPLLAAGLALLQAICGDDVDACQTADEVPNPDARGLAQAAVSRYLLGAPAYLEVGGDDDTWTLSILCVIARHLRSSEPVNMALAPKLIANALETENWYRVLPLLGRIDPDAVQAVVEVLDRHRCVTGQMPRVH